MAVDIVLSEEVLIYGVIRPRQKFFPHHNHAIFFFNFQRELNVQCCEGPMLLSFPDDDDEV